MRISDWSSDVCSSDLFVAVRREARLLSPCSSICPPLRLSRKHPKLRCPSLGGGSVARRPRPKPDLKDRRTDIRPIPGQRQLLRKRELPLSCPPDEKEIGRAHV